MGCCWYHKGTNFQANHNKRAEQDFLNSLLLIPQRYEFSSKSQLGIDGETFCCVVADTTKVRIFKQITTLDDTYSQADTLLLIPQRYEFSSKSQQTFSPCVCTVGCCWYHKGTNFQANHNRSSQMTSIVKLLLIPQRYEFSSKSQRLTSCKRHLSVVADTTKVRIFKQITTGYTR